MLRKVLTSVTLAAAVVAPRVIEAQSAAGLLLGWVGLSVGAMNSLAHRPSSAEPVVGSRIRFRPRSSSSDRVVGRIVRLDQNTLTLDSGGGEMTLATSDARAFEISTGSRWAEGWRVGLLVGAAGGATLGFASGDDPPGWFSMTAPEKAGVGAIAFGVLGSTAGALFGLAAERWVAANGLGEPPRVSVVPLVGTHLGLATRVTF